MFIAKDWWGLKGKVAERWKRWHKSESTKVPFIFLNRWINNPMVNQGKCQSADYSGNFSGKLIIFKHDTVESVILRIQLRLLNISFAWLSNDKI